MAAATVAVSVTGEDAVVVSGLSESAGVINGLCWLVVVGMIELAAGLVVEVTPLLPMVEVPVWSGGSIVVEVSVARSIQKFRNSNMFAE